MTNIGELRHRVRIERKARGSADGAGGYATETWSELATVWAKVDPKLGRELVTADQVVHRLSHTIIIRRRADITASMRVIYQGRTLAIVGIRELSEGRRWTELQCEETDPS